jgi:hypothetical protein
MLAEEKREGGVGHNWEKFCIGLFHVSEHLGHFKAITKKLLQVIFLVFYALQNLYFTRRVVAVLNWSGGHGWLLPVAANAALGHGHGHGHHGTGAVGHCGYYN